MFLKKIKILLLIFCLSSISNAYSQIKIGIKTGVNISNGKFTQNGAKEKLNNIVRFNAGLTSETALNESLFLRSELLYSWKGWAFDANTFGSSGNMNMHYITVPLLVGYNITPKFSAVLGPEFGYLIKAVRSPNISIDYTDFYRRFDMAASIGLLYRLSKNIGIETRYTYGFIPVAPELPNGNQNLTSESYTGYNKTFQAGIFYFIGNK
ncbi:porin family protein [Cytophagaceae bacterium YF14B1]|uniref:Porin family protein n=1 Tax=Xanthocytophaga flava TaxID=3048013 RepID=A0AAE3UCY3_9BACT|nr:porin family protein [Xanthocytophaga flavus]MDJ1485314.1 porin family protein [Xanthocytophaga flavus]